MSRFEPNVEPSMEEILASIRRIIAEDTSGSRTVPPPAPPRAQQPSPVRPNAGVRPVASPQRGFMSREAFMKSSAPAEEADDQRFFTPVTPQDPLPAAKTTAAPASEARTEKASPSSHEPNGAKVAAKPIDVERAKEVRPSEPAKSDAKLEESKSSGPVAVEVKAVVETEQKSLTPEAKSEAQIIDAQLVELLGEDLKALRESDERQDRKNTQTDDGAAKTAAPAEVSSPKAAEPAVKVNGASSGAIAPPATHTKDEASDARDSGDPFAFDLGPSPFLPRSSHEKAQERKNSVEPTPGPQRALGSPRGEAEPSAERGWTKINGTPATPEIAKPATSLPRSPEPAPSSAAQRSATFVVPSVSATLGPHRKLEPLSEAFKPAPSDHRKPVEPPSDPFPFRDFGRSAETSVERSRDHHESRLQPASPPLSALPPLDAEASPLIGGDRTMEDAVADLLRPLLKTWLAENMPKIVERALRREMTERLLPGQKNSRD